MRGFSITATLIASLIVHTAALGSDSGKVSIGILYPESYGDSHKLKEQAYQEMTKCVQDVGFYVVCLQNTLEQQFNKINVEFPVHCRDPRCVIDIGSTAGMDRMLYGSIDYDDNRFGVQLTLIDVVMKQKIEAVSIEGAPGVSLSDIIRTAIARLHGNSRADSSKVSIYHGPKVHNEK